MKDSSIKLVGTDVYATPFSSVMSARIDSAKPFHVGTVSGIDFYEHPFDGDESPLIVKIKGVWLESSEWDCPQTVEIDTPHYRDWLTA